MLTTKFFECLYDKLRFRDLLMVWKPDVIDWLALKTPHDYEKAITELLGSNPVLNGSPIRPTGDRDLRALYKDASRVVLAELMRILINIDAYEKSEHVQHVLIDSITKHLIFKHYAFMLTNCRPKPTYCPIFEAQVWFPASYYLIKGNTVFDWEHGNPQREFYGSKVNRHPAIVAAVRGDGLYLMVPVTHSMRGSVPVSLDPQKKTSRNSGAKYSFGFRASWVMLHGDTTAANAQGLRVTGSDFAAIQGKLNDLQKRL
jgi:hypothetical protein